MKRKVCLVLAVSALPFAAAAEITGGVTLSYGMADVSDTSTDITTAGLDGRVNVAFQNGFSFGLEAGTIDLSIDGAPFDLTGDFIALDAGYRFGSGVKVGGYVEELTFGIDLLPDVLSLESYGLSVGYEQAGFDVEAFAGRSSTDPDLGIDVDNIGLTAGYSAVPGLMIGAAYIEADLESGGTEVEIDFTGLAGTYAITETLVAFGGLSRSSVGLLDVDVDSMGFGLGYDLAGMTGLSSTVSLELARTELSSGGFGGDLETVRLGVTFPFGAKGPALPINSVADSILNPRHGALNAALTAAF